MSSVDLPEGPVVFVNSASMLGSILLAGKNSDRELVIKSRRNSSVLPVPFGLFDEDKPFGQQCGQLNIFPLLKMDVRSRETRMICHSLRITRIF